MSWSVTADGTHDEATQQIGDQVGVPQSIKDALGPMLADAVYADKKVTGATLQVTDADAVPGFTRTLSIVVGGGNATLTVATTS